MVLMLSHSELLRAISLFSDAAIDDWLTDLASLGVHSASSTTSRLGFAPGPNGIHERRIRELFAVEDAWDLEGRDFSVYDLFAEVMGVSADAIGSAEQESWMGIFSRYCFGTQATPAEWLHSLPAAA